MYHVMIVDDEEPVLDSFAYMLEKFTVEFSLSAKARSGYEAIEMVERLRPDIVFMDIAMPGIDGLDTITELQRLHPDTLFIISTAYERFDIAKRAVPLGIFEYLVKPVTRSRFIETLEKAKLHLDRKKNSITLHVEELKKKAGARALEEKQFLHLITWKTLKEDEWLRYREMFAFPSDEGAVLVLALPDRAESTARRSAPSEGSLPVIADLPDDELPQTPDSMPDRYLPFMNLLSRTYRAIAADYVGKLLVFVSKDGNSGRLEQTCLRVLDQIGCRAGDHTIGIGRFRPWKDLFLSCSEALEVFGQSGDRAARVDLEQRMMDNLRKQLASFTAWEVINGEFEQFESMIFQEYGFSVGKVKLVQLLTLCTEDLRQAAGERVEVKLPFDLAVEIAVLRDRREFHVWACRTLRIISEIGSGIRIDSRPLPLRKAIAVIHAEFAEPLQLGTVARSCDITPAYLSRLFSEHLHATFIDYLTGVRIARAEEHLQGGYLSVKETARAVGYGDPSYFSRIFRKYKGMTPSEYADAREL